MNTQKMFRVSVYGVLIALFWMFGSFSIAHATQENRISLVEKSVTSLDEVDETMMYILSLNKKERKAELDKYGVYKMMSPHQRLEKLETAMKHYEMAKELIKITNYADARMRLNRALAIEPNFIEAHLLYAKLYRILGNKGLELQHIELAKIAETTTYPVEEQWNFLRANSKVLTALFEGENRVNIILRNIAVLIMLTLVASLFTINAFREKRFREEEYRRVIGEGTFNRDESIDQLVAKMKGPVDIKVHKYKMAVVYGVPFVFFLLVSNLLNFQGVLLFVFSVLPAMLYDVVIHFLYFRSSIEQ